MSTIRNIALLTNPVHQRALAVSKEIITILKEKRIQHTLFTNHWPDEWMNYTEAWIVGGDGTLNYFINHYPQFELPMSIFKGGTGNDFHWMLYADISVADQVEKVLQASPKPVDAGLCNEHIFINGIGIGLDGKVVQDLLGKKKWNGKLSYYAVVLKNIFQYNEFDCTVNNEDFAWHNKSLMINIASGKRYGGGFFINPDGEVNDGMLEANIVGKVSSLKRIKFLSLIENGKHTGHPAITYAKATEFHIKTGGIIPAHADGEYFDASEFVIECLPAKFFFLY